MGEERNNVHSPLLGVVETQTRHRSLGKDISSRMSQNCRTSFTSLHMVQSGFLQKKKEKLSTRMFLIVVGDRAKFQGWKNLIILEIEFVRKFLRE